MEKELIEALKTTIQIQNDLINHLKQEVQRLQASQIVFNPPSQGSVAYQPLPLPNPLQPNQPFPFGPWWGTQWVTTSDQTNINFPPNTTIFAYNGNQTSPEVSAIVQAGATNKEDKFIPFAII